MTAWAWVALSFVPGALAIAWHRRERRKLAALDAARAAEVRDTLIRFVDEERESGKYESFSNWPMGPKGKR